jgi:hypothetical protein
MKIVAMMDPTKTEPAVSKPMAGVSVPGKLATAVQTHPLPLIS